MSSAHRRWHLAAAMTASAFVALTMTTLAPAAASGAVSRTFVEMTPALQAKIQETIETFRTSHGISGISVAVVTPDRDGTNPIVTTFAAGAPSFGSPTPVDASTQFELGSESKAFTADLLSYLVATNQVSLDDAVQLYAPPGITVPEWVDPGTGIATPITLRDLATHQSALPDLPSNFSDGCGGVPTCVNPRPGYTQTMLWDGIQSETLLWQPGTRWLYSNWGFGLLGTILANVLSPGSDPPAYQSALDGAFLASLGMSSTMLEPVAPTVATPYSAAGTPTYYWENTNAISGAGGLISNATDMGTWVAAHLGYNTASAPLGVQSMAQTLQPVSTITTMCSTATQCDPADFQMGLAWQLYPATKDNVGEPWAFKNGGTAGSSTDTVLAASVGIGVTTMFNMKRVDHDQVAVPILRLLIEESHRPTLAPTGVDAPVAILPGLGAAALLAFGWALAVQGRKRSSTAAGQLPRHVRTDRRS